jgi:hypothetical protein
MTDPALGGPKTYRPTTLDLAVSMCYFLYICTTVCQREGNFTVTYILAGILLCDRDSSSGWGPACPLRIPANWPHLSCISYQFFNVSAFIFFVALA